MGFTIGMPSLKLSNVEGKGGKHCGNFGKVAKEALGERQGVDLDINPELAEQNIYEGFATAEELIDYSNKHIAELNQWRAEHGERACDKRKLKSDTVVMCVTVIKPPAEMMSELSNEQQHQILKDSYEIFKGFVGEENIKAAAFHFDERVPHLHIFWEPMTNEHRICAKEMHNLKFFGKLNREMPKRLREKGWAMVDDCQAYDKAEEEQKRIEMGEEKYKEYRKAQKANRGRDSRQFKHEVENEIAEKQKELERVQAEREAAERAAEQARQQREADEQKSAELQATITNQTAERDRLANEATELEKALIEATVDTKETKTVKGAFGKEKEVPKTDEELKQDKTIAGAKLVLKREAEVARREAACEVREKDLETAISTARADERQQAIERQRIAVAQAKKAEQRKAEQERQQLQAERDRAVTAQANLQRQLDEERKRSNDLEDVAKRFDLLVDEIGVPPQLQGYAIECREILDALTEPPQEQQKPHHFKGR